MNSIGADYWREMGLVVPTRELVVQKSNADIKFEASVLNSVLIMPEDKIIPPADLEQSSLEIKLNASGSGMLFIAYSVVSSHIEGIGHFYTSKRNIAVAKLLNESIRNNPLSSGIFGGTVLLGKTFLQEHFKYVCLELAYAEFPKDSGLVYLLNRDAPFVHTP